VYTLSRGPHNTAAAPVEPLVRCVEHLVDAITQQTLSSRVDAQAQATQRHEASALHCSPSKNKNDLQLNSRLSKRGHSVHHAPPRHGRSRSAREIEFDTEEHAMREEHWNSSMLPRFDHLAAFTPPMVPADLMRRLVQLAPEFATKDLMTDVESSAGVMYKGHAGGSPEMSLFPALLQRRSVRYPSASPTAAEACAHLLLAS
jgi:hypothetical protein